MATASSTSCWPVAACRQAAHQLLAARRRRSRLQKCSLDCTRLRGPSTAWQQCWTGCRAGFEAGLGCAPGPLRYLPAPALTSQAERLTIGLLWHRLDSATRPPPAAVTQQAWHAALRSCALRLLAQWRLPGTPFCALDKLHHDQAPEQQLPWASWPPAVADLAEACQARLMTGRTRSRDCRLHCTKVPSCSWRSRCSRSACSLTILPSSVYSSAAKCPRVCTGAR